MRHETVANSMAAIKHRLYEKMYICQYIITVKLQMDYKFSNRLSEWY